VALGPAPSFDAVPNFRDAGGLPTVDGGRVRTGVLYRSGHLAGASPADLERLSGIGVRVIVDLRRDGDIAVEGENRVPDGARIVRIPIGDVDSTLGVDVRSLFAAGDVDAIHRAFPPGAAHAMMMRGARVGVEDELFRMRYASALRAVVEADGVPTLVNCSAGKDRTGWTVALVLLAVGVDREDVVAEYLRSNDAARPEPPRAAAVPVGLDRSRLEPLFGVRAEYIENAFAAAEEGWGSMDAFLEQGAGLRDTDRQRLRDALVDPAAP